MAVGLISTKLESVCIGIADSHGHTEHRQVRFSSFTKDLQELCNWLAKYNCNDVCMRSTGIYWVSVVNILEKNNLLVAFSHLKYTKPQKGNKTNRKDVKCRKGFVCYPLYYLVVLYLFFQASPLINIY